ncbi:hypothetical protein NC651_032771 [Populus alba x Populus x berolinensis]|nr:hypothetical protein NC651_032771 [Populus alba x Populus x berolinensis]
MSLAWEKLKGSLMSPHIVMIPWISKLQLHMVNGKQSNARKQGNPPAFL